jgi:hypothetical protein
MMADYTGADGSGILYINSMSLVAFDDADPDTGTIFYATDGAGGSLPTVADPGTARYFPGVMAMFFDAPTARPDPADQPPPTAASAVSTVVWRDDGTGNSPVPLGGDMTWTVDSWLNLAKLKMDATNKEFVWDNTVANGTTPDLVVHELYQVTQKYREESPLPCMTEFDVTERTRALYWEVWRPHNVNCTETTGNEVTPNPKECMTLPTLPVAWPRAGVDAATGKEDGFPTRGGAGNDCVDAGDCSITGDYCEFIGDRCNIQTHKSCTINADCTSCPGFGADSCSGGAIEQVCLTDDGTRYIRQHNVWHLRVGYLGMAGSFDFNGFLLGDRLNYLTHESTNRLDFNQ